MGKFIIKKRADGQFQFNLKAGNGEIILTSEGYVSKQGCENGIESVRTNSADADQFENRTATNEQLYFVLKAGNGEIIGTSELYVSEGGRENGIESVRENAPVAEVEDQTTEEVLS